MIKAGRYNILPFTRILFPGILFLLIAVSCKNSMQEINELVNRKNLQEDKGIDVTILYSKNGKVQARLFAHEFIRNESAKPPYTDMKNGLKVEFFNDSAQIKNTLTARYARWYEQQSNILIRDSVVIVTDKGERLETEELVWNQSMQQFFTEKPVRVTTATQVWTGTGMKANQDFTQYEIENSRGVVKMDKKEVPAN